MPDPAGERLDSWKAIAAHFNRDVRTVRRWEKLEGLPVHRHSHSKLASVYAFRHELDRWSAGRARTDTPPVERRWPLRLVTVGIAILLVAGIAGGFARWRASSSARVTTLPPPVTTAGRIFASSEGEGQAPRLIDFDGFVLTLAIVPDGSELIVLDRDRQAIQFIDTAAEAVSQVLPLGSEPIAMVVSPDGGWIYVSRKSGDVVRVNRRTRSIDSIAKGIQHPSGLALTNDGRRLYIAAVHQGLRVVDLQTGTVGDVPTVECPMEVVTIPGRDFLYVGYQCGGPGGREGHDAMDVRTASTGALIKTIVGPPQVSSEMAASPDGAQVWIDGHDACIATKYDHAACPQVPGGVLHAYRTDDHLKLASFGTPEDEQPEGLAFLADSSRIVMSGGHPRVFDTKRMAMVERSSRETHGPMTFTPDGGRAFAITSKRRQLAVYDLSGDTCAPPPAGLVAWWPGDGHSGDVQAGNDAALRNGATFAPGLSGQAFVFDGVDDYLAVPSLRNVRERRATIALAVKPRPVNKAQVLVDHPGIGWQVRRLASGHLEFCIAAEGRCGAADRVTSRTAVQDNKWTEIAVTEAPGTIAIYLDGKLDSTAPVTKKAIRQRQDLRIGGPTSGRAYFSGLIDEVRVFNLTLGAGEINRMHAAGRSGLCVR